jgi:hypothetical protein
MILDIAISKVNLIVPLLMTKRRDGRLLTEPIIKG